MLRTHDASGSREYPGGINIGTRGVINDAVVIRTAKVASDIFKYRFHI
jgi:hypothetical protein